MKRRMRALLIPMAWALCVLPLLRVGVQVAGGVEAPGIKVFHRTGYWAMVWICVTLACTPATALLGWTWPLRLRRTFGLCAFAYASVHAALYLGVAAAHGGGGTWEDLAARWFILPGLLAFALLLPLAVTSPRRMMRHLGFRRWKLLHSTHYIAAALACLHYAARAKPNAIKPQLFAALLLVFFLWRLRNARHKSLQSQRSH